MLGFADKRVKAVEETELYMRSMFAGLVAPDERLPVQVFADPYVAGFLQVLATHSVATAYLFRTPDTTTINEVLEQCLDRMVPGGGATVRLTLAAASVSAHPLHANYLAGRHDGSEHVRTLLASDEIARNEQHEAFRSVVKRYFPS